MARYRKLPVAIEAVQYTGTEPAPEGVCLDEAHMPPAFRHGPVVPHIHTLEGPMSVSEGDWIATGIAGEKYPIKDHIFRSTYVLCED